VPIPKKIGKLNKRFINRITTRLAGKSKSPFALIQHQGRKSGIFYETPILVVPIEDGFLFALTYGPDVDWYKNIQSNGYASLRWKGIVYDLSDPQNVEPVIGRTLFRQPKTTILRWLGIEHFFKMKINRVELA